MHRNEFIHEFIFTTTLSLSQTQKYTPLPRRLYLSLLSPPPQSRILEANQRSPRALLGQSGLSSSRRGTLASGMSERPAGTEKTVASSPLQQHSMLLNIVLQTRDILVRDNQN